jgi:hypothetical protein
MGKNLVKAFPQGHNSCATEKPKGANRIFALFRF